MKTTAQKNSIRRALLAKVHIAVKEMGIDRDLYEDILREEFPLKMWPATKPSSCALSVQELARLVDRFQTKGWKAKSRTGESGKRRTGDQAGALKEKIGQMVLHTDFDELRLRGLVRKICQVDDLKWCGDAVRLKKLLAVIGSMMDRGDIKVIRGQVRDQQ